jgi:hypothetical protein
MFRATRRADRTQPGAPTEPNFEAEVLSATAETAAPTEPNSEPEVPSATAEMTAPTEPNASRRASRHAAAPHPDS